MNDKTKYLLGSSVGMAMGGFVIAGWLEGLSWSAATGYALTYGVGGFLVMLALLPLAKRVHRRRT